MPTFYEEIVQAWLSCGGGQVSQPTTFTQIRKQIIWNNKFITLKHKPLLFKHWIHSGFVTVDDLLNEGGEIKVDIFYVKHYDKRNWQAESVHIISAIPEEWKAKLKRPESTQTKIKQPKHLTPWIKNGNIYIMVGENMKKSKIFYNILCKNKFVKPYICNSWTRKFNISITIGVILGILYTGLSEKIN